MCAPCKIILDAGVRAVADATAEMVREGKLTDDQMNELSALDEIYLAAMPRIVMDGRAAVNVLTEILQKRE